MFSSIDGFGRLQDDLLMRGRTIGGVLTILAYALTILGAICETWNFLRPGDYETTITLDQNNDKLLQVNVDITMHRIECKNLRLLVKDSFGEEPLTLFNDFTYRPVSSDGSQAGVAYEELHPEELEEKSRAHTAAEQRELDADWDSSHDGFQHKDFHEVIQEHDFVFANFFASWCSHCRNFAPAWKEMADDMNHKLFMDADGRQHKVLFIKVNCVDFSGVCGEENIEAYPTLRLYKKDMTWNEYDGDRTHAAVDMYISKKIRSSHVGFSGSLIKNGCNIQGRLMVPRVPGMFKIEAGGDTADQRINPATANVSHTIQHLSFSDPDDSAQQFAWLWLPSWVTNYINPLDSQRFITSGLETAPHHYVKLVSTKIATASAHFYQMSATNREARVADGEVPEMRVLYDLQPMMIEISRVNKPWYDFVCGLLGVVGGIYVTSEAMFGMTLSATKVLQRGSHKSARSATASLLSD